MKIKKFFSVTVVFDTQETTQTKAFNKIKKVVLQIQKDSNKDIEISSLEEGAITL